VIFAGISAANRSRLAVMTAADLPLLGVIAAGLAALAGLASRLAPKPKLVPIPIPIRDPRR